MDVRLTTEQQQLRDAAAKLADDLGPGSVADLDDESRIARLDRQIAATGWRSLRSDEASGVEVAIVVEEFGRGLVDAPYLGPVLADDLTRHVGAPGDPVTIAVDGAAADARGFSRAVLLRDNTILAAGLDAAQRGVDLSRAAAAVVGEPTALGELDEDAAARWYALALVATTADLVGISRGALALATDYAKIREQYGKTIGSYQAVAHLLAESAALIEGSVSVLRHAAWAVDELAPAAAVRAAQIAKVYCARTARTVCETSIQVHGGIGNTWECLAHVYLRRALTSTELLPVKLEEIDLGLS
jgi:alkylation response protein AidB-like acyl-CoA dehydrogenase